MVIKKLFLLGIILINLVVQGCNDCSDCKQDKLNCSQVVKNSSPYPAEISLYQQSKIIGKYEIITGDSLVLTNTRSAEAGCAIWNGNEKIDSAIIIFSNMKKLTYYKCRLTNNPCDNKINTNIIDALSYEWVTQKDKTYRFTYIITQEAYNKAK